MANKKCLVYETLGSTSDLKIVEQEDSKIRLTGVFGVCGVRNENKRIYSKQNYGMMVEALQKVIATEGCPGELEHPNSMNIDLNNVSHKIEEIQMNEDGTITGTILLLDTHKGLDAQAIVKGGLPLYISSRGAGTVDESGNVTLSTIKTYDLVGTPGFSQAKLNLKKNQKFESLNESLEDGPIAWAIVEGEDEKKDDDLLDDTTDKKDSKKKDEPEKEPVKEDEPKKDDEPKDEPKEDEPKEAEPKKDKKDNKTNNTEDIDMNELKEAIDKLTEKVTSLEAELHIAKESLASAEEKLANINDTNYEAIEAWVKEEFAPDFKTNVYEEMAGFVEGWITEEFAPEVQNWVCEEFAPEVQNWVCEEFAPEVEGWITEEFAPEVQNWVCEEFAPEVEGWITEEFAPTVEGWINEEFAPEQAALLENKINENLNGYLESQKDAKYDNIDKMLESLSNEANQDAALKILKEQADANNRFKGVFIVENMPAELRPSWETLSEARKDEIVRSAKMYDFTKKGSIDTFWNSVEFANTQIKESKNAPVELDYHKSVVSQMFKMRH